MPYKNCVIKLSAYIKTPYTETAVVPPKRSSKKFIIIEVKRPETLFKNIGQPHTKILAIIAAEKLGRQNLSCKYPRQNGYSDTAAPAIMARLEAKAAAQMPHPKTARNKNSSTKLITAMPILRNILVRICPQMRR